MISPATWTPAPQLGRDRSELPERPPFNEPDFNTPQLGSETLLRPSVILEVWRNLKDRPLLTQNYDAYSRHLWCLSGPTFKAIAVKQCRSRAHLCTSLWGVLGDMWVLWQLWATHCPASACD